MHEDSQSWFGDEMPYNELINILPAMVLIEINW